MEFSSTMKKLLGIPEEEEETPVEKFRVPLDQENAKLLKDSLDAQGGSKYIYEPEGILSRAIRAAGTPADASAEEALTGIPKSTVSYKKKPEEKTDLDDYSKWFDPEKGEVEYENLMRVGIPQPTKRKIVTNALENMSGLPAKYLNEREPLIPQTTDSLGVKASKTAVQVFDSVLGNVLTGTGKHIYEYFTGAAHRQNPNEVLTPDEISSVKEAYGKQQPATISLRIGSFTLNPSKSEEENLKEATAQKIFAAQDALREATNIAIVDDVALIREAIPAARSIKGVKAVLNATKTGRTVGKALNVVDAITNPLSAAVSAKIENQVARSAAKGTTSALAHPAVGPTSRITTAAAEGALLQPIPLSEERLKEKPEQMLFGAALGAGIGGAAEVGARVAEPLIVDHLLKKEAKARTARLNAIETQHPGIAQEIINDTLPETVPITPEDKAHLVMREALKQTGVNKDAGALSIENFLRSGMRDSNIQKLIDVELLMRGTSVARERNLRILDTVNKTSRGVEGLPSDSRSALEQFELAIGNAKYSEDTGRYTDTAAAPNADPFIVASLSSNTEKFIEAMSSKFPQMENVLRKAAGQHSLEHEYRMQAIGVLGYLIPDDVADVAGDAISQKSALLYEVKNWLSTEPGDVTRITKLGKRVHAMNEKLTGVGDSIQEDIHNIYNALHAAPEGGTREVPGVTRGSRMRNAERVELAKTASEKFYREVSRAIETGAPIHKDYLTSIKTDFGGIVPKEQLDGIIEKVLSFNELHGAMKPHMDSLKTMMVKRSYLGQKRTKAVPQTEADAALGRVYSTTDNIEARLHQEFIKPIMDRKMDMRMVNPILEKFPAVAEAMASGKEIPSELVASIKADAASLVVARKAAGSGEIYKKKMDTFGKMLDSYNRQARAVDLAATSAAVALEDSSKSMEAILTTSTLTHMIDNPVFMDRLEIVRAYTAAAFTREVSGMQIPAEQLQTWIDALTGDATTQLRIYSTGEFAFQTHTHMLTMFEALKHNTARLLDTIDDLNRKNLGVPLDREVFLGYFIPENNLHGRTEQFKQLQINTDYLRAAIEGYRAIQKRSEGRAYDIKDAEGVEVSIQYDTHLAALKGNNEFQGEIKRATTVIDNEFKGDLKILRTKNLTEWAGTRFNQMFWKLNGSKGVADIGELFYGIKEDGTFVLSHTGEMHKRMFIDRNAETSEAFSNMDREAFVDLYFREQEALTGEPIIDSEHIAAVRNKAIATFEYFKEPSFDVAGMGPEDWKSVWDASQYIAELRLRAWKKSVEILAEQNLKYRGEGKEIHPPEWRTFYVTVPKKKAVFDIEAFENTLFRDFDEGRYWRSEEFGQVRKAEKISLGFDNKVPDVDRLETAAMSVYGYIQGNINSAYTAHVGRTMEEYGQTISALGFRNAAAYIRHVTRDRLRAKEILESPLAHIGTRIRTKTAETGALTAMTLWWDPAKMIGLRGAKAVTKLSRPISLGKNMLQSTLRTASQDVNPIRAINEGRLALQGAMYHLKNPEGGSPYQILLPEENKMVTRALSGYKDSTQRNLRERLGVYMGVHGSRKGAGTEVALAVSDVTTEMVDWTTRNFKERTEMAVSRANLEIGVLAYRELVEVIREKGSNEAYAWLSNRLPTKPKPQVWSLVTQAADGVQSGNVNVGLPHFLDVWHTSRVGRYGTLALPAMVSHLAPTLPSTFRFWPSRFQNIVKVIESINSAGEAGMDWMRNRSFAAQLEQKAANHPKWKGIPRQQRIAVWPIIAYSSASLTALKSIHSGTNLLFPGSQETRDRIQESENNTWWRFVTEGTGIDLTWLSPLKGADVIFDLFSAPKDAKKSASRMLQGIVTVRDGFLDPTDVEAIKAVEDVYIGLRDGLGIGLSNSLWETKLSKAREDMHQAITYDGKETPDYPALREAYVNELNLYYDTMIPRIADHLLDSLPPSVVLPLPQNPFVIGLTSLFYEKARYAADVNNLGYRGYISDMVDMFEPNATNGITYWFEEQKKDHAEYLKQVWGFTDEKADTIAGMVQKLHNEAYDFDRYTGFLARNDPKTWDLTDDIREKTKERQTRFQKPENTDYGIRTLDWENRMIENLRERQGKSKLK